MLKSIVSLTVAVFATGIGIGCGPNGPNNKIDAPHGGGSNGDGGDDCQAPDMLVLLDRTMSMHRRPDGTVPPNNATGHMQSKWNIAITAVETLTAKFEGSVQFGLALFPRDPGGGKCVTLSQRIAGTIATNMACEPGELVITPALTMGAAIAAALDPETTLLCTSTPIGAGLGTAKTALAAIQAPIRDQYVLFLGDGNDTCDAGLVLSNTHAMAAAGVKTFVVAFDGSGGGIDNGMLNDMACAGQTATGFPAPCTVNGQGNYRASNRSGPALYLRAENAAELTTAFTGIAGQVCCGCVL